VERYAFYFRRDFFVAKAFAKLNSEEKPEHVGFRKVCETLYQKFCLEQANVEGDMFIDFCYRDEMYLEFAADNVARFFTWMGVLKETPDVKLTPPVAVDDRQVNDDIVGENPTSFVAQAAPPPAFEDDGEDDRSPLQRQLSDLNRELQTAMSARDTGTIRTLMAQRADVQRAFNSEKVAAAERPGRLNVRFAAPPGSLKRQESLTAQEINQLSDVEIIGSYRAFSACCIGLLVDAVHMRCFAFPVSELIVSLLCAPCQLQPTSCKRPCRIVTRLRFES
jgi:hypothetical protein